ncbi:hypothetical protein BgAZ_203800 [Babesia gibsoni]|uniref:RNAse P Rpr2/Rpp21 subunit domain-containing protein n=1 Tax=Babesia gibsoni TaxID=33632 RepID=A0AAD8LJQ2_BABGI|nr:hypothetical protein BgAZ_203800 [Babesia gibsoni]
MNKTDDAEPVKRRQRSSGNKRSVVKNVHLRRLNFLNAAAELMSDSYPNLSRLYIKELKEISEKHVIRLDKEVKRRFCKGCNTFLVPDKSAVVEVEYHGVDRRQVARATAPQGSSSDTISGEEAVEETVPSNALEESRRKWLSITCCICSRTRRVPLDSHTQTWLQTNA